MAKDVDGNPLIYDTQDEGDGFLVTQAGDDDSDLHGFVITRMKMYFNAGGDIVVSKYNGGPEIVRIENVAADTTIDVPFNPAYRTQGIYMESMGQGDLVYVYLE